MKYFFFQLFFLRFMYCESVKQTKYFHFQEKGNNLIMRFVYEKQGKKRKMKNKEII